MAQWQEELVARLTNPVPATETNPAAAVFRPTTASIIAKTVTAVSSIVVGVNPARRRLVLMNDSGAVMYIAFGPVCSTTLFTLRIDPNDYFDGVMGDYTGVISAVRGSGSSNLLVTEISS